MTKRGKVSEPAFAGLLQRARQQEGGALKIDLADQFSECQPEG